MPQEGLTDGRVCSFPGRVQFGELALAAGDQVVFCIGGLLKYGRNRDTIFEFGRRRVFVKILAIDSINFGGSPHTRNLCEGESGLGPCTLGRFGIVQGGDERLDALVALARRRCRWRRDCRRIGLARLGDSFEGLAPWQIGNALPFLGVEVRILLSHPHVPARCRLGYRGVAQQPVRPFAVAGDVLRPQQEFTDAQEVLEPSVEGGETVLVLHLDFGGKFGKARRINCQLGGSTCTMGAFATGFWPGCVFGFPGPDQWRVNSRLPPAVAMMAPLTSSLCWSGSDFVSDSDLLVVVTDVPSRSSRRVGQRKVQASGGGSCRRSSEGPAAPWLRRRDEPYRLIGR